MEDTTAYRIPEDFNPCTCVNAIRGLTDAIHHFLLEGPGTKHVIPFGDKAGLESLIELLQAEVHALHDYLHAIANRTSLKLPLTEADFEALEYGSGRHEVREATAVYAVQ